MKNSFSRIGVKMWNSIPDSESALAKYKFKNTLQSRLLDSILIQEDTFVGVRALLTYLVNIKFSVLYYYMRNFCNLIGLEQWYFSSI